MAIRIRHPERAEDAPGSHRPQPGSADPRSRAPDPCNSCPFCALEGRALTAENELAAAFPDGYPVNPGHTLIVPHRHVATWFEATRDEQIAMLDLADRVRASLDTHGVTATVISNTDPQPLTPEPRFPDGYNLGVNAGTAAGQTIMHLHLHLIPRFAGDVDDPTGGVRFVIPARGNYRKPGFIPSPGGASLRAEPSGRRGGK